MNEMFEELLEQVTKDAIIMTVTVASILVAVLCIDFLWTRRK